MYVLSKCLWLTLKIHENFTFHLVKYIYRWKCKECQIQQEYLSLYIYFCLQNVVLNHVPKARYQLIARTLNLLLLLCCNYNLIALVGDFLLFLALFFLGNCKVFPFESVFKMMLFKSL